MHRGHHHVHMRSTYMNSVQVPAAMPAHLANRGIDHKPALGIKLEDGLFHRAARAIF